MKGLQLNTWSIEEEQWLDVSEKPTVSILNGGNSHFI
jgi:hypothetical protein